MDTSQLLFPKSRPRALDKVDRDKRKQSTEDRENTIVKARSKGQCEVREVITPPPDEWHPYLHRCRKDAREIHHLLGGSGRRGVKESALAVNKIHCCSADHKLITEHVLQGHWTDVHDRAGTIFYVRLK